jgi:hypothetical protein
MNSDLVFQLMVNTFVTMFRRRSILDEKISYLRSLACHLVPMNAADWHTPAAMHRDLAASLGFPSYYRHNPEAFNDCLRDIAEDGRGWPPSATGFTLVFLGFDSFAARYPGEAWGLLDIIARQCRTALVYGRRMLCLVQSDDPDLSFEPVGAVPVMWNDEESLDTNRA